MSTRSRIGLQLKDQSIISVYCHADGSSIGIKLIEDFNSYDKAAELIDGGDISNLCTNRGWNNEFLQTYTTRYFSSRGEDCPPRIDSNLKEYLSDGEEYAYLFTNGEWVCYNTQDWSKDYLQQVEIPLPVAV